MVKISLTNDHPCSSKGGDYIICEVNEQFSPLPGSGVSVWSVVGNAQLSKLRTEEPMQDFEIKETPAFQLDKKFLRGVLHLKLPIFDLKTRDEKNDLLSRCYDAILEKAVELGAKKIVIPFLGLFSVNFPKEEGVEVAINSIHNFITGGNNGLLEEIEICTNHHPTYKIAIKNTIYIQHHKSKKKSMFSFLNKFRIPEGKCVFETVEQTFDYSPAVKIECSGRLTELSKLRGREQTFECEHVVDMLLLRGGIEIDWKDGEKSRRIFEMSVCANHKQKLLTCWDSFTFYNRKNNEKLTCSLPEIRHEGGVRPETAKHLKKHDVLKLIQATSRFFPVGIAVCTQHADALHQNDFKKFIFKGDSSTEQDDLLSLGQMEGSVDGVDNVSEIESNLNIVSSDDRSSMMGDIPPPIDSNRAEKNRDEALFEALREVASFFGFTRLTSVQQWSTMQPDTQRKKINGMLHLIDELFRVCAGAEWQLMKSACIKKMGLISDSSQVTKILQSIDEQLECTTDRRERLSLVSILTGHFPEKDIIHATGVSRYFIREAKKYAMYGLDDLTKPYRRVKYHLPSLNLFAIFLSIPSNIVILPKPCKSIFLSSGESLSIAHIARRHSYRLLIKMFHTFLEERGTEQCAATGGDVQEFVRTHSLGYSTCIKIMETVLPVRQKRMQCVDRFQTEAIEAFDSALTCVSEMKEKGQIAHCEAGELVRRFRVAQNYLTGYFRMHLSVSSTCSSHCIRYALSDQSSPKFQSPCDHQHEDSCDQCNDILSVFAQFKKFLNEKWENATTNNQVDRFCIGRMVEECKEWKTRVMEFQKHILRSAMSEQDRVSIIDNLKESCSLITMDFSLKLMPTGFIESQSQWYGKAGISFHISHVQVNKGGKLFHHTLGHLHDDAKQDSIYICAIGDHLFQVLSQNGVTRSVIRSDCAGNYRNGGVIHTLRVTAAKYGICLDAYIFSEPQSGKGVADNRISHAKGKIRSVVDSGGYGRNAEEILESLCTKPLLKAYSFYQVKLKRDENEGKRKFTNIRGITDYSSFRYEEQGIRLKKFDSIGQGVVVPYTGLEAIECDYEVPGNGGHLSMSPEFWGEFGAKTDKEKDKEVANDDDSEDDEKKPMYRCREDTCGAKFLTAKGLEDHEERGKHRKREHKDSVVDAAARLFSEHVESNESAYLSMKIDSFAASQSAAPTQKLSEGWAVRIKKQSATIHPPVRAAVKKYFLECRSRTTPARAEAKFAVKLLRNQKNPDGSYTHKLSNCLKESQAQGLIGRWLKLEASGGLAAVENERKGKNDGDDVDENCDYEDPEFLNNEPAKKKAGRPKKKDAGINKKNSAKKGPRSSIMNSIAQPKQKKKKLCSDSSDDGDMAEDDNDNEDDEPGPSTAIRRRIRTKKASSSNHAKSRNSLDNEKKNSMTHDDSATPSTRILRSRKRGNDDVIETYYESNYETDLSEYELDNYTLFMNEVHQNYDVFYTDQN